MKINNIKLQNYRSHSNFETDFTSGINLLLGNNGVGKSSILEAIGITLFGAKPRTTLSDTIRFGDKSAFIEINFTGNDGNIYRVEKKIGQAAFVKLYFGNENSPRLSGEDANKFIKELVGLNDNPDVIYKNIITAEQNKFTEIFQLGDAKRAEEFNKIFNTEIYREIYQKNSRTILNEYESELKLKTQEIMIHSANLQDVAELQTMLENENIELNNLKINNATLNTKISTLEIEKTSIEKEIQTINKIKTNISKNQSSIKDLERLIEKLKIDLNSALKSKEIIDSNKQFYEQYQEIEKTIKTINSEIKKLNEKDDKKKKIEKEIDAFDKEIHSLKSKIDSNITISKSKNSEINELENQINDFNNQIQILTNQINELDYKISLIGKTKSDFTNLLNYRNKKISEIDSLKDLIDNKEKLLINEDNIHNEIEKCKLDLEKFELNKAEKIKLETQKEQLNVSFKILTEAKTKLQGSICPYFSQKCKNLDDDLDSNLYFDNILNEIKSELVEVNSKISNFKNIEKEIDSTKNKINQFNNKLLNNKDLILEIEKYSGTVKTNIEALNTNLTQIEMVFQNHKLPFDYDLNDLENTNKNINTQFDEFTKFKTEKVTNKKNIETNIANSIKKISNFQNEIKQILIDNQKYSIKIEDLNDKISNNNSQIEKLNIELFNLPDLKMKVEENNIQLESIKPHYIAYTKNFDNAGKVISINNELEKENNTIFELNQNLQKLVNDLKMLDEQKLTSDMEKITSELKNSNNQKAEFASKIAKVSSNIENLSNTITQNITLQNKIENLKKEEIILNRKIALTQKFREYINTMGTIVAGRMLDEIARKASDNYFKISQKAETIEWLNNQSNQYQVFLIDNATKIRRKFEMLSGGEQVSVAIAIRTALSQSLTSANFAIFDEPTINLDKERKELLSRSLNTMLENLEQVLIVTHDDTFREMAEAIEVS